MENARSVKAGTESQPRESTVGARRPIERARVYFALVAVILASWSLDVGISHQLLWEALEVRCLWALGFVAAGLAVGRFPRASEVIARIAVGGSSLALVVLAYLTGGSESPYFYMLPVLPVLVGQVEQTHGLLLLISAGTVWLGGITVLASEGRAAIFLASWSMLVTFFTWWARYWFLEMRRSRDAEIAAERARATALEELAEAQAQRTQAEKLALIGRLAAGVAHEVNNPLAFVTANLEFVRPAVSDEPLRHALDDSLVGVERIRQIVADLRAFARADLPTTELEDPGSVILEAKRLASVRLKGIREVHVEVEPGLPPVSCNRGRLVQVLLNLLVNAADAVEAMREERTPEVRISARRSDDRVIFEVQDNGPGVPADVAERLFQPFVTTKGVGSGMGLGLALSREYIAQIGGAIRLVPVDGPGACFAIELPAAVQLAA